MSRLTLVEAEDGDPDHPSKSSGEPSVWNRPFVELLVAQALFSFAYATFLLLPKILAVGYGASAGDIGFVMAAFGVVSLAAMSRFATMSVRRRPRRATAGLTNGIAARLTTPKAAMTNPMSPALAP